MTAVLQEKLWALGPLAQLSAKCQLCTAQGVCRRPVQAQGEPLLNFGLFPCWAASAAGTEFPAAVAFYSQIFFF